MPPRIVRLLLTCLDVEECAVYFEPEGAEHRLTKGDVFHVEISGPESGDVEVSYLSKGLSICAWSKATTRVWDGTGRELPT